MQEITHLLTVATQPGSTETQKQQAFGKIVSRYQDMAYGWAYARLGDSSLAEEAAQEAFILAWLHLEQLRQPEAFTGWFRRILASQCTRLSHRKQVATLPWQEGLLLLEPDAHSLVERAELKRQVWQAIHALPDRERQMTILFHISAYTRAEIAAFLGVSETTVKRQLASARRHLKEGMIQMLQDDLHAQRPSRNEQFAARVGAFTQQFSTLIEEGQSIVRYQPRSEPRNRVSGVGGRRSGKHLTNQDTQHPEPKSKLASQAPSRPPTPCIIAVNDLSDATTAS